MGTAAVLATISFVSYATLKVLKKEAIKKLPNGMSAKDVEFTKQYIIFKNVSIDKKWIVGNVNEVRVDYEGNDTSAYGGVISIDLDKKETGTGNNEGGRNISFEKFDLSIVRGPWKAEIREAHGNKNEACFKTASLNGSAGTRPVKIEVSSSCAKIVNKSIQASEAKIEIGGIEATGIANDLLQEGKLKAVANEIKGSWNDELKEINVKNWESGVLSGEGTKIRMNPLDIMAEIQSLTVDHRSWSSKKSTFKNVTIDYEKENQELPWTVKIGNGATRPTVRMNDKNMTANGTAKCSEWVNALPEDVKAGPLKYLEFSGELSFSVSIRPEPKMALDARCKAVCKNFPNLKEKFSYKAYDSNGKEFERTVNPKGDEWTPIGGTGRMSEAVMSMEDLAFPFHRGYLSEAFQNSLSENVLKGKMVRGGSTITQQTAKNVWLGREKTISRKISELFLAQAMESCMKKDQILETYLNVVEFGPDTYGVTAGSKKWFGKKPDELEDVEAYWMASILPRPRSATYPSKESMASIEKMMSGMVKSGRINGFTSSSEPVDTTDWEPTK